MHYLALAKAPKAKEYEMGFPARILIVEDHETMTINLKTYLERRTPNVRIAPDAEAAIEMLQSFTPTWSYSTMPGRASMVVLLRADVTAGNTDELALMREHQVLGPPTVMLFDTKGRERRDTRLVGEFSVEALPQRNPARSASAVAEGRS